MPDLMLPSYARLPFVLVVYLCGRGGAGAPSGRTRDTVGSGSGHRATRTLRVRPEGDARPDRENPDGESSIRSMRCYATLIFSPRGIYNL